MSARRAARAQVLPPARGRAAVPVSLRLGPCVELWAEFPDDDGAAFSARRRWGAARDAWLRSRNLDSKRVLSSSRYRLPWSVEFLANRDPVGSAMVRDRLADAGCDFDDLDDLRNEATRLLKKATRLEGNQ